MKKIISGKVREVYDLEDGRMVIDDTNQSWSQVYKDVDQRYGRLFGSGDAGTPGVQGYRRIIRAEFLKYTD